MTIYSIAWVLLLTGFTLTWATGATPVALQADQNGCSWDLESHKTKPVSFFGFSAQGVAFTSDGQAIFSGKNFLRLTSADSGYHTKAVNWRAIPKAAKSLKLDHIGDIEIYEDKIIAPIEEPTHTAPYFVLYHTSNLSFTGEMFPAAGQKHCPWIAADNGVAWSSEFDNVETIARYSITDNYKRIEDFRVDFPAPGLMAVQGGAIFNGALILSTNSGVNINPLNQGTQANLFAFDLSSGKLLAAENINIRGGEMEGIAVYGQNMLMASNGKYHVESNIYSLKCD